MSTSSYVHDIIRTHCTKRTPIPTGMTPQLEVVRDIRAVLFDIYGTLFVSRSGDVGTSVEQASSDTLVESCHAAGLPVPRDPAAALDDFFAAIRRSNEEAMDNGVAFPEIDIREIWREVASDSIEPAKQQIDRLSVQWECRVNPVWPMPGLQQCLPGLRDRDCSLGIVSNAQWFTPELFPALCNASLEELGFRSELVVFSWKHRQAKPGVYLFERAVDGLAGIGITAEQTLFVGNDMLNDIQVAAQVGLRTALFAGDQRSLRLREGDDRVAGVVPDLVITELTQILDCLAID